jgi:hypothetical protein
VCDTCVNARKTLERRSFSLVLDGVGDDICSKLLGSCPSGAVVHASWTHIDRGQRLVEAVERISSNSALRIASVSEREVVVVRRQ